MFNPDTNTTYKLHLAHLEEIRNAQVRAHAAEVLQGQQPNQLTVLVEGAVAFTKRLNSRAFETVQTANTPRMQLNNEQA